MIGCRLVDGLVSKWSVVGWRWTVGREPVDFLKPLVNKLTNQLKNTYSGVIFRHSCRLRACKFNKKHSFKHF